ncbi:MAG: AAA family ATPase [Spirochaetota bacterium]
MESVNIAGISVAKQQNQTGIPIFPSNFIETDTSRKNLQNILYPLLENYPVLLVGDAGVGKNALIYHINYKRNHPTVRFSFNEDTLPEDLIGSYRLLMNGSGFEWVNGPLIEAISKGTSFVADEMNLTSPAVIKRFATVYESSYIDLLEGNGSRVVARPGFNFIATQNPAEGFEGRKSLPYEITRNFAVVYIDEYPPDEIFYILQKLYPELQESLIQACIQITIDTERQVTKGELGKTDLEKYHFNLRTLKKICKRLSFYDSNDKSVVFREVSNLYLEPFRSTQDREKQKDTIAKQLGFASDITTTETNFFIREGSLYCNDKTLDLAKEEQSKSLLSSLPMTKKIRIFLEKVVTAIQMKENILLEYSEEDDINFLIPLLTGITGQEVEFVNLSRGIHTSDILGSLKPVSEGQIEWIDGPLTRGVRNDKIVAITALEAAGAELIEKLNMLLDDARALSLPPESGEKQPLELQQNSVIFAWKLFRKTKSTPTISRAFRNRFSAFIFPKLDDKDSLKEILEFYLSESALCDIMLEFHGKIKTLANKRTIGSANIAPYVFGLSNMIRWKDHILHNNTEDRETFLEVVKKGAMIYYINQISDPKERQDLQKMIAHAVDHGVFPDDLFQKIEDKKKTYTISTDIEKKRWWDPKLHKREPNTGKARLKNSGNPLKKGIEINTPETGGNTKEGPDAWYGRDTRGNKGQGEPAGGGGAWGYRTDELYKQFLAKRKVLWDYSIRVSRKEYQEVFGRQLEEVELNLEKLFDPEINITRTYRQEGKRIDTRKYIAFKNGRGDTKVFDKTIIDKKDEKLKGVEIVFLVSKARRIFNFEFSIAVLSALITSSYILNQHNVRFAVHTYSDRFNRKDKIDLHCIKNYDEEYDENKEEEMFNALCVDWQGDSIYEYLLLENCERYFTQESSTRIVIMISDFRGQRGKLNMADEIHSSENQKLKNEIIKNSNKSYIFLGIGMGSRNLAEHIFPDSVHIHSDNFANMPNLLGTQISRLLLTHHNNRA